MEDSISMCWIGLMQLIGLALLCRAYAIFEKLN